MINLYFFKIALSNGERIYPCLLSNIFNELWIQIFLGSHPNFPSLYIILNPVNLL